MLLQNSPSLNYVALNAKLARIYSAWLFGLWTKTMFSFPQFTNSLNVHFTQKYSSVVKNSEHRVKQGQANNSIVKQINGTCIEYYMEKHENVLYKYTMVNFHMENCVMV